MMHQNLVLVARHELEVLYLTSVESWINRREKTWTSSEGKVGGKIDVVLDGTAELECAKIAM